MTHFGIAQLEVRIGGECRTERRLAFCWSAVGARNEREMLVGRCHIVAIAESFSQGSLEHHFGPFVLAILVKTHAVNERAFRRLLVEARDTD